MVAAELVAAALVDVSTVGVVVSALLLQPLVMLINSKPINRDIRILFIH